MSRTIGAIDRSRRKTRSDKGSGKKKRTNYNRLRRLGNKDSIKIWIAEVRPMNYEAYLRWDRNVRHKIKHEVYIPLRGTIQVPTNEINTKDKFVHFIVNVLLREGDFLVRSFSHGKNKYHVKPVKLCRILIKSNEYGLYGRMTADYRLFRYRWWIK